VHRIAGKKEEVATCLAFLPDSRWLIKGGADGSLSLLDTWGEKQSVDLPRLTDVVSTMAISPDGSMFVAGGVYSGNNIGSLGQRSWSCELHDQSGIALAYVFSSDGRTLAIGTENPRQIGSLSLVNAHTGDVMEVLLHDARAVTSVAFSPEGRFVAAGVDSDVQVWDSYRKERLHLLRGHHHAVILLAFSSNGRVLASGSSDKTIRLWDINTGNLLSVFPCENRPLSIWFNPELPQLLVASLQDSHLMPIIHMLELGNMSFSVTA